MVLRGQQVYLVNDTAMALVIAGRGPASVSELARPLSMSLAAVVQHVQVLEVSGLVRSQKIGRTRTCSIEPAAMRSAEEWISDRRASWERKLDRLGEYLQESASSADTSTSQHGG
jgi:DNA-binding transcriptional ArsR family regulator